MHFQRSISVHSAPIRPGTACDRIRTGINQGYSMMGLQCCRVTTETDVRRRRAARAGYYFTVAEDGRIGELHQGKAPAALKANKVLDAGGSGQPGGLNGPTDMTFAPYDALYISTQGSAAGGRQPEVTTPRAPFAGPQSSRQCAAAGSRPP